MGIPFSPPKMSETAFNCPFCNAYSNMLWSKAIFHRTSSYLPHFNVATCTKCKRDSYWHREKMIFPRMSSAPLPSSDLPDIIISEYNEARDVVSISPRAAAALIRLAVQKMMPILGGKGDNINSDIKTLVDQGLPKRIQKALDSLRVIGNNAVHPGQIDLEDNEKIALALFNVLNIIVEDRITKDKQIDELYDLIPDSTKKAIKKRDS